MEDAFFACVGGGDPTAERGPVATPAQLLERILADRAFLPAAPLVHAAGMWTTLRWLLGGCKVVLLPKFAAQQVWEQIARERVTNMNIVGDAMARPLFEALPAKASSWLSCLQTIATGGAPLSPDIRERLLAALPQLTLKDTYGASETGSHGWAVHTAAGQAAGFATVDTVLLDPDTHQLLPAGLQRIGLVARRGRVPLRYHGDAVKSAATFLTVKGERCALTGDLAQFDADGALQLLGRQSQCINSGGEKIYPEEVEQALRAHPDVADAAVVGVADERWGQQVVAVVAPRLGSSPPEEVLRAHCRRRLAGYKVPKQVLLVAVVQRTVAGKLDYRWAKQVAFEGSARVPAEAKGAMSSNTTGSQPTIATVRELAQRWTNWGRWGPEDQLGTLNHLDAACRVAAASLVRTGEVLSLAIPLDSEGPQHAGTGRFNPIHLMSVTGRDFTSPGSAERDARRGYLQNADDVVDSAHANGHAVGWLGARVLRPTDVQRLLCCPGLQQWRPAQRHHSGGGPHGWPRRAVGPASGDGRAVLEARLRGRRR